MPKAFSIFLVSILLLVLYAPSLSGPPLWDDNYFIFWKYLFKEPPSIIDVWRVHLWPFFDTVAILLYKWWGQSALYWRLLNLLLHGINSWLVAKAIEKWKPQFYWPVLIMFIVHPLNVMSVASIIQLKTLMCTTFFLLAAFSWMKWDQENKIFSLVLSIIFFALSLTSKSSSITYPFIAVCGFLVFNRLTLKRTFSLIPFFVLVGLFLYRVSHDEVIQDRVVNAQETTLQEPPPPITVPVSEPIVEEVKLVKDTTPTPPKLRPVTPIQKAVVVEAAPPATPMPLPNFELEPERPISKISFIFSNTGQYLFYPIYPWPLSLSHGRFTGSWPIKGIMGLSLFVVLLGFYLWKKMHAEVFILLAQVISLVPFLGFVFAPYMTYTAISEQHLYMMLPFSLLLQLLWWDKLPRLWKGPILSFVIIGLMFLSYNYTPSYKSEETLFRRVMVENPNDVFAHVNLAAYYQRIGHKSRALIVLRSALEKAEKNPLIKKDPSFPNVERALKLYELE